MAGACIHGFEPGTCLICQTLDAGKDADKDKDKDKESKVRRTATSRRKALPPTSGGALAASQSGPRVVPPEAPAERSTMGLRLIGMAVAVIAIIVVAWTALRVAFAILHLVELVGVALLAGYIGWRAGVYHGRRTSGRH